MADWWRPFWNVYLEWLNSSHRIDVHSRAGVAELKPNLAGLVTGLKGDGLNASISLRNVQGLRKGVLHETGVAGGGGIGTGVIYLSPSVLG